MDKITRPAIVQTIEISESLATLTSLISRQAEALSEIKRDKKLIREQEQSVLDNDVDLADKIQEAEEFIKAVKERKAAVRNLSEMVELKLKKKELSMEEKEVAATLSNHLVNYHNITGSKTFDAPDGSQVEFKTKASFSSKQLSLF